jgi:hypothetical protein
MKIYIDYRQYKHQERSEEIKTDKRAEMIKRNRNKELTKTKNVDEEGCSNEG